MTWEPLAGGAVLALSGAIFGLWQLVRLGREQRRADRAINERDLLADRNTSLTTELAGERVAREQADATREAVIVAQRLNYAELQRRMEKYEALDPAAAGAHLGDVLRRGPGAARDAAADAPAGLHAEPAPGVGPGRHPAGGK